MNPQYFNMCINYYENYLTLDPAAFFPAETFISV